VPEGEEIATKSSLCNLKSLQPRVSAIKVMDPCMPNDKFDGFLLSLVQLINPSTDFVIDNILHQNVQCVHQTLRPKDVRMHPLNDFSCSLTFYRFINDYLKHIRRTNIINGFNRSSKMF
jgi:hypothetical protein